MRSIQKCNKNSQVALNGIVPKLIIAVTGAIVAPPMHNFFKIACFENFDHKQVQNDEIYSKMQKKSFSVKGFSTRSTIIVILGRVRFRV